MITRRRFLQGTALAGVAVAVAPLALQSPATTPAVIPVEAASAVKIMPYQVRLMRLILGGKGNLAVLRIRRHGRSVFELAAAPESTVQWMARSPFDAVLIEPGDAIEVAGGLAVGNFWADDHGLDIPGWSWRHFQAGIYEL